jgi:hypothetical protein
MQGKWGGADGGSVEEKIDGEWAGLVVRGRHVGGSAFLPGKKARTPHTSIELRNAQLLDIQNTPN